MTALAFPKPRLRALEKKDRVRDRIDTDILENQKVRARSEGRCEVKEQLRDGFVIRCQRKAFHVHHLLKGWGRRGRGESELAKRKQHTCVKCHTDIENHILSRVPSGIPHFTDAYRRAR